MIVREHRGRYRGIEYEQGTPDAEELITLDRVEGRLAALARRRDLDQADLRHRHAPHLRVRVRLRASDGRRKVTAVHKANIMKFSDGLWLRVAREVAAENPDVEFDDRIVDNMCMQLVRRPEEYDVLVLPSLRRRPLGRIAPG